MINEFADLRIELPSAALRKIYSEYVTGGLIDAAHRLDVFESFAATLTLVGASQVCGKDEHGVDRFAAALVSAIETGEGRVLLEQRSSEIGAQFTDDTKFFLLVVKRTDEKAEGDVASGLAGVVVGSRR